ncbi:MAG: hypothetical protein H6849_00245 [Alphaproteobacteria bacterium]|nr:MAG: hypothetical protein H6849_00245 [Alphaproteobacteria bacterium]
MKAMPISCRTVLMAALVSSLYAGGEPLEKTTEKADSGSHKSVAKMADVGDQLGAHRPASGGLQTAKLRNEGTNPNPHDHWLGVNVLVGASQYSWKSQYGRLYRVTGSNSGSFSTHDSSTPRMSLLEAGLGVSVLRSISNASFGLDITAFPSTGRIKLHTRRWNWDVPEWEILDFAVKKKSSYRGRLLAGYRTSDSGLCYAAMGVSRETFIFQVTRTLGDIHSIVGAKKKKTSYVPEYSLGYRHALDGSRYTLGAEFSFQKNAKSKARHIFNNGDPDELQEISPTYKYNKYSFLLSFSAQIL